MPEPRTEPAALEIKMIATTINPIQSRKVNICPALIRFFQNNATAGSPAGRSVNGERLRLAFREAPCQLFARAAATRAAIFCEASTDASSKLTFERMTH